MFLFRVYIGVFAMHFVFNHNCWSPETNHLYCIEYWLGITPLGNNVHFYSQNLVMPQSPT